MTAVTGFPLGTLYPITHITQAMPGKVTLGAIALPNSFAIAAGQTVTISKTIGMEQLNDNRYIVGNFDANAMTFDLYDLEFHAVDTTSFVPYVSGGELNIISYPPTAGNPPGLMFNNQ